MGRRSKRAKHSSAAACARWHECQTTNATPETDDIIDEATDDVCWLEEVDDNVAGAACHEFLTWIQKAMINLPGTQEKVDKLIGDAA